MHSLALERDDADDVAARLDRLLPIALALGVEEVAAPAMLRAIRADLDHGDVAAAAARVEQASEMRWTAPEHVAELVLAAVEIALASRDEALLDWADRQRVLTEVVAAARGAVLALPAGNPRGHIALARAERLAATWGLVQVQDRVAALRESHAAIDDGPLEALSDSERRMVRMVADGCSNREIGEALFLSEKTVRNSMSRVFAKLGVSRRTEAAALVTRAAPANSTH